MTDFDPTQIVAVAGGGRIDDLYGRPCDHGDSAGPARHAARDECASKWMRSRCFLRCQRRNRRRLIVF